MEARTAAFLTMTFALTSTLSCAGVFDPAPEFMLYACDNPTYPNRKACDPNRHLVPMTIALYDQPGGELLIFLVDSGDGIPFDFLEAQPGWWKVRVAPSGATGYVDTEEPFGGTMTVHEPGI